MKFSKAVVRAYSLAGFDRRQGATHGMARYKALHTAHPSEAITLVACGWAVWRGRAQRQITLLISPKAYLGFLGQMRYKGGPEVLAIDSRTHRRVQLRYEHVRNQQYSGPAVRITDRETDATTLAYLESIGARDSTIERLLPDMPDDGKRYTVAPTHYPEPFREQFE